MQLYEYFITLKSRVDLLNRYLSDQIPISKDFNNPFNSTRPKTYVWIEKTDELTNE